MGRDGVEPPEPKHAIYSRTRYHLRYIYPYKSVRYKGIEPLVIIFQCTPNFWSPAQVVCILSRRISAQQGLNTY